MNVHPWIPWLLGAVLLLASVSYLNALDNPFLFDDTFLIVQNSLLRDLAGLRTVLLRGPMAIAFGHHYRPVAMLTFWVQYQLWGINPMPYRLFDVLLHLGNGLLAFLLLRRLLRVHRDEPQASLAAWLGTSLFLLHPIQSVTVDLLIKRTSLLATTFTLLCLLTVCRMLERPAHRKRLYLGGLLFGALALLSKEEAAGVGPLVAIVCLYLGVPWRRALALSLPFLIGPLWLVLFRFPKGVVTDSPLGYLLAQPIALWSYLSMLVWPDRIAVAYDLRSIIHPFPWDRAVMLVLLCAVAGVIFYQRRRWPLLALACAWAIVIMAPSSSIVAMPTTMDEVRVYLSFLLFYALLGLPLAALMLRAEALVQGRGLPRLVAFFPWLFLCVLLVVQTLRINQLWSDSVALFEHAVSHYPRSHLANTNLCNALLLRGELDRAIVQCTRAMAVNPGSSLPRTGLVHALVRKGRLTEAEAVLSTALQELPADKELLHTEGDLSWYQGQYPRARGAYEKLLAQDPHDDSARIYLTEIYIRQREFSLARQLLGSLDRTPPQDQSQAEMIVALRKGLARAERAPPPPAPAPSTPPQ